MKKFLQAVDESSNKKSVEGSNDMKKFMQIVEGRGPLNRLTAAESMAMQAYSQPHKVTAKPKTSSIDKYYKKVSAEFAESAQQREDRATALAKKVTQKITERISLPDPNDPEYQQKIQKQIDAKAATSQRLSMPTVTDVQGLNTAKPIAILNNKQYHLEVEPAIFPRSGQRVRIPGELIGSPGVERSGIIYQDWIFVYPATNEGVPSLNRHIDQSKIPPDSLNRRAKNFAGKRLKW